VAKQQQLIYKLQLALKQKGYILSINTNQFYSVDKGRYIKGYTLMRKGNRIYKSYSSIKIIKYLVNILDVLKPLTEKQIQSRKIDSIVMAEMIRREELINAENNKKKKN
jgi:hypothetical protein